MSRRAYRAAFSLVELLVVLGILAILMAIILPAVSKARRQAQAASCRSRLHQIGTAIAAYASANKHALIPYGGPAPYRPPSASWPELLFKEKNARIVICPATPPEYADVVSYQLNSRLRGSSTARPAFATSGPSNIVLAAENLPGTNYYYSIPANEVPTGISTYDPARHGPGLLSNFLWLDMHVDNEAPKDGF